MKPLAILLHGSHMFGLATEHSDKDFKTIFMPDVRDITTNKIQHTKTQSTNITDEKNTSVDIEETHISLHKFIDMSITGDTLSVDLLHAPKTSFVQDPSDTWLELVKNRHRFYTKNMKSLIGYARAQAAKYGMKGSRIDSLEKVISIFENSPGDTRVSDLLGSIPSDDNIHHGIGEAGIRFVSVCGKHLQATATVGHYLPGLRAYLHSYGSRAREARENKNVDWKAISHAFRAALQLWYIIKEGGFEHPLPQRKLLLQIKTGQYTWDKAGLMLDELINEVEKISQESSLPQEADKQWAMNFLHEAVIEWVRNGRG